MTYRLLIQDRSIRQDWFEHLIHNAVNINCSSLKIILGGLITIKKVGCDHFVHLYLFAKDGLKVMLP